MNYIKQAPFTMAAICVNVAVFLLTMASPSLTSSLALSTNVLSTGQYLTLVTSAFVHSGMFHIVMNMMMLWCMGSALEHIFGSVKVAVVYSVSILTGSLAFVAINTALGTASSAVGASGAVFGLLGMYTMLLVSEMKKPRLLMERPTFQSTSGFFACLAVNLVLGFMPGIAWEAHLGGFIGGAISGWLAYIATCRKHGL